MASSSASNSTTVSESSSLQRNSKDVGWEFGMLINANNQDKIKCKLCGKEISGGIYRLKQHVARLQGNVSACPKSTPEQQEKCKLAIKEAQDKRKRAKVKEIEIRSAVNIDHENKEDELEIEGMGNKKPRMLGPLDRYAPINLESPSSLGSALRQQNIQDALAKERLKKVHEYIGRWVYTHGIAFNAIDNDEFKMMVEAIGMYGPGATPPSQYLLREPLLKAEVERMKELVKEQEEEWKKSGCSVMTDAWTDRKRRSIMNLCINSRKGTMFHSSKDCSSEAHTGQYIFEYVKECIEKVGIDDVVQVVTDNATNNMAASKLLKEVMPNIFWTCCATHTINLMLESIAKLDKFKETIEKAKALTIFIYAHHKTLSMMRVYTKKKDIVRPGVTRFASAFLTLQSLDAKQENLKMMFASKEWLDCKWSKHSKGKTAYAIVTSLSFWNGVTLCLKVFAPLVRVLRLVDGDLKPTMGFLHGELQAAKKDICATYKNVERNYLPILNIIDERLKGRLDSPLHLAGYLLNPFYAYKDSTIHLDADIIDATFKCVEAFFPNDLDSQSNVINTELPYYTMKEDGFGKPYVAKGLEKSLEDFDPVHWWMIHGNNVRLLQKMAIRILSLTTSSSGCERNWSTFEGIHTKKRNRLETKRLHNLVYVQFNARLTSQRKKQKNKGLDVLLASDASNVQDWIVEGAFACEGSSEDMETCEGLRDREDDLLVVRELDESDFESEEEEMNVEFESDEEHFNENYGEVNLDS